MASLKKEHFMEQPKRYPFRLSSVQKSPVWGGTKLLTDRGKRSDSPTVGESWELTVRKNENSMIENGAFAGQTLGNVIKQFGGGLIAPDYADANFPLLIKLIDACDKLSVQVHPDDAYAKKVENDRGKTEMWYILSADDNAEIVFGLADGVGKAEFANAVNAGKTDSALRHVPVKSGDVFFIPAGLVHAIGRGILIAEIQQNCDLTYRVYDYGRRDKNGNLRELHIGKALDVARPFTNAEIGAVRFSRQSPSLAGGECLADCKFFRVEKLAVHGDVTLPDSDRMRHLLCVDGSCEMLSDGVPYSVEKGRGTESWFLPPHIGVKLKGDAVFIVSAP